MSNAMAGGAQFPDIPKHPLGIGFRTELVTVLGPTARVAAYVRSGGPISGGDNDLNQRVVTTLNQGLAQCRASMGDIVLVAHDHAENVSTADQMSSLVAGTRIIGLGYGTMRPTLTWTANGATFLLDVANVTLDNFILNLAGPRVNGTALTVAAPITVSAAGCAIRNSEIHFGFDANQIVTIGVTLGTAADDFVFADNHCWAETAGATGTTFLRVNGADRAQIIGNRIVGASSGVAIGLIQFLTTASLNILMLDNYVQNNLASSTAAVTGLAGVTGFVDRMYLQTLGSHTDFEVIGDANGVFSASGGSLAFGADVYGSGDLAQSMISLTPDNA